MQLVSRSSWLVAAGLLVHAATLSGCSDAPASKHVGELASGARPHATDGPLSYSTCNLEKYFDVDGRPVDPNLLSVLAIDPDGQKSKDVLDTLVTDPSWESVTGEDGVTSMVASSIDYALDPSIDPHVADCLRLYRSLSLGTPTTETTVDAGTDTASDPASDAATDPGSDSATSTTDGMPAFNAKQKVVGPVAGATVVVAIAVEVGIGLACLFHEATTTCNKENEETYCLNTLDATNSDNGVPSNLTQTQCQTYCRCACGTIEINGVKYKTRGKYAKPPLKTLGAMFCDPSSKLE